jgi:hypothetical protein
MELLPDALVMFRWRRVRGLIVCQECQQLSGIDYGGFARRDQQIHVGLRQSRWPKPATIRSSWLVFQNRSDRSMPPPDMATTTSRSGPSIEGASSSVA